MCKRGSLTCAAFMRREYTLWQRAWRSERALMRASFARGKSPFPGLDCVMCCGLSSGEKEAYDSQSLSLTILSQEQFRGVDPEISSRRWLDQARDATTQQSLDVVRHIVRFSGGSKNTAGIGAVFGVDGKTQCRAFLFFWRVFSGLGLCSHARTHGPREGLTSPRVAAESGTVFFNTAVPGSSCWEALLHKKIQHGDVLFAVDGSSLYRSWSANRDACI